MLKPDLTAPSVFAWAAARCGFSRRPDGMVFITLCAGEGSAE